MTDIAERLRDPRRWYNTGMFVEAADEIERLKEVDAARFALFQARNDEIERLRQDVNVVHADICAENDNMRAEIERLRMALEMMVAEKVDYMTINHLGDPEAQHTIKVARAALGAAP